MYIAKTNSTNNNIRDFYLEREDLFTLVTDYQSSGRGQQGNGWESEDGKNLLFSTLLRDWNIHIADQFVLTEIVSLSLYKSVYSELLDHHPEQLAVKWPNDLYYGDKKLSGVLIENICIGATISRSIVGVGLNVNQEVFLSQAPNPISLKLIIGKETDRTNILHHFIQFIKSYHLLLSALSIEDARKQIHSEYMSCLYRREGQYLWQEREVSLLPSMPQMTSEKGQFVASIDSVTPNGELVLLDDKKTKRTYHFKQIRFVLA